MVKFDHEKELVKRALKLEEKQPKSEDWTRTERRYTIAKKNVRFAGMTGKMPSRASFLIRHLGWRNRLYSWQPYRVPK
jgi:hypothetical protein